jgi:hypothetical protein
MSANVGEYLVEGLVFPEKHYKFAIALAQALAKEQNRKIVVLQKTQFDGEFSTRIVDTLNPR